MDTARQEAAGTAWAPEGERKHRWADPANEALVRVAMDPRWDAIITGRRQEVEDVIGATLSLDLDGPSGLGPRLSGLCVQARSCGLLEDTRESRERLAGWMLGCAMDGTAGATPDEAQTRAAVDRAIAAACALDAGDVPPDRAPEPIRYREPGPSGPVRRRDTRKVRRARRKRGRRKGSRR